MADYTLSAKITGDSSNFQKSFSEAEKAAQNFQRNVESTSSKISDVGAKISSVGKKITGAVSAAATSFGAVSGMVVKVGSDFEAQMSRVQAISGATASEFEALREQAIQLGAETSFSASEAAQGMENLAAAGFTTREIMDAMPGLLDMAAASGEDLATSSDIAAATLRGFGLAASEAGHVADVLAENANRTNSSVTETGEAMKYIAPVARATGISMEETAAAIGIMANAGIQGSQAGTTLRGALSRLSKPTKSMVEAMDALGISFYDSDGKMKSLSEQVAMLESAMSGLTDEERNNYLVTLYGQESLSGMLSLINEGSGSLEEMTAAFENCDGSAAEAAATMRDNLQGSIEEFKGSVETLGIRIYDNIAEPLKNSVDMATQFVNAITEGFAGGGIQGALDAMKEINPVLDTVITKAQQVADTLQKFGIDPAKFVGIVSALGPALIVIGKLVSGFGKMKTLLTGLSPAVVVIGAIAAAFGYLMATNEEFRDSIMGTVSVVGSSLGQAFNDLLPVFQEVGELLLNTVCGALQQLAPLIAQIVAFTGQLLVALTPIITQLIQSLMPTIQMLLSLSMQIIQAVMPVLMSLMSQLMPVVMQIVQIVGQLLLQLAPLIQQLVAHLAPVIMQIISSVSEIISTLMPPLMEILNLIMGAIEDLIPPIMDVVEMVIDAVSDVLDAISPIVDFVSKTIQLIISIISPIISFVADVVSSIVGFVSPLISTFSNIFSSIFSIVTSIMSSIGDFFGNIIQGVQNTWNGLVGFVNGIFDGIRAGFDALVNGAKSIINGFIGAINGAIWIINLIPGVHIDQLAYLRHGTDNWQGGFAYMNEGGRGELTYLPNGAQVIPHDISVKYAKEAARANTPVEAVDLSGILDGVVIQINNNTNVDGLPLKEACASYTIRTIGNQQRAVLRAKGAFA